MNVLIACEESQRVCIEFRKLGHRAFSCDLKDCSGGFSDWHIKADCKSVIEHGSWDIIIAHPPCTYLSKVGSCNMYIDGKINAHRYDKMMEAREFFMYFYNLVGCRVCIENPIPFRLADLPPYSQCIQPYEFGDPYTKMTLLWLKDLPYLVPLCYGQRKRTCEDSVSWTSIHRSAAVRSKTFPGIAKAMAAQWSNF